MYDAFLSYNWRDRTAVEIVARGLLEHQLTVFLDRWYLVPGQPWPETLERIVSECRAVVVFLGPHGMGSAQQREKDLALARQPGDPTFQVVPVLLPGSDQTAVAGDFLSLNTWVDLRDVRLDDPQVLLVLARAIHGEPPGADLQERIRAARATVCPYRGLLHFREDDAPFFFGRAAFIEPLARTVADVKGHPLVAVVGASGSGKSSVVRAGLVPRLRQTREGAVWDVAALVPGDRPLRALSASLLPLLEPEMNEVDRLNETTKLAGYLTDGTAALRDIVARVLANQPGTTRLLLVIDQWEELYTLTRDEPARRRFIDEVLQATEGAPLSVVATLRGDFFDRALNDRALADRLQGSTHYLGPMKRDELKEAMEAPARRVGLSFETGLVDRILDDVEEKPGSLPLLEFVLTGLWEARRSGQLLHEAYEAMGTVQGAIARRAEEVFGRLPASEQEIIRHVFLRLVQPGEATADTRGRSTLAELGDAARDAVKTLADARLLVTGRAEATDQDTVEVAHEALISHWPRLREWLDADREFLLWRQRFRAAFTDWMARTPAGGRAEDYLLTGARLTEATSWQAARREDLSERERAFVAESARVSARNRRRWLAGVTIVTTTVIALALYATWSAWQARQQATRARVSSIMVAATTEISVDPVVAALLLAELGPTEPPDGARSARRLASAAVATSILRGHDAEVVSVAFSPDGSRIVTGSGDGTARVWRTDGTGRPIVLHGHTDGVESAVFAPDGARVATASRDRTARVWRVDGTGEPVVLRGHEEQVRSVAFDREGTRVVTASGDSTARVWRADGAGTPVILRGHDAEVVGAVFSPDGSRVVTASADGTARVWQADGTGKPTVLRGHSAPVEEAVFNPDGSRVVTASLDHAARVWRADGAGTPVVLRHESEVVSSAFSPDGLRVVTASADGTVRVWQADGTGQELILQGHGSRVSSAVFSPDGSRILTASLDHTARVWRAGGTGQSVVLLGHGGQVERAAFSPDGTRVVTISHDRTARVWRADGTGEPVVLRGDAGDGRIVAAMDGAGSRVATASADGTVRLWPADGTGAPLVLRGHQGQVWSVAFSPDGSRVVTASDDGTARLWRADGAGEAVVLRGHQGRVWAATFSPDGARMVTASEDATARVWHLDGTRAPLVLQGHHGGVWSAAFSPDGARVVTASADRTARVWRADGNGAPIVLDGHQAPVRSASFNPDGSRVVTASDDGTARLWPADGRGPPVVLRPHQAPAGSAASVVSAVFSPDGSNVLTASDDRRARVWRADGTGEATVLQGHDMGVLSATFSADGSRVVTGSADGTARVWLTSGSEEPIVLRGHEGLVLGATFSRDGTRVLTASDDGTARVWRIQWAGLVAYLEKATNACLSPGQRAQFLAESAADAQLAHHACERGHSRGE